MKLAIATRADDGIKAMTDITHPIMRKYAEKIGADFIILDEKRTDSTHYRILKFYDLFEKYDRIISMDSDIVITPDCPNLFDLVPEDSVGTVYEDVGSRQADRRNRMARAQEQFGDIGWKSGYINTGVAVFSKCHREIFKERELYMGLGYDDVYLGYWIHKLGFNIYQLAPEFNFMTCFAEMKMNRTDARIIHYAGQGFTGQRMRDLKRDAGFFYGDPPGPELKNQAIFDEIPEDAESIADIGCGEGFFTKWLMGKTKANVYAIDPEDTNRMNLKVLIGDLTEPETFPIKAVDVSIASEVLEHVRWWKEALQTLLSITTRKVIITIPFGNSFNCPYTAPWDSKHVNYWDDENINEFIDLCRGWKVEIKKILTKPEDKAANQLVYLITCTK